MDNAVIVILLVAILSLLVFIGYCYQQRKRFIRQFTKQLQSRLQNPRPLCLNSTPRLYSPIYQLVDQLIVALPQQQHIDKLTGLPNRVAIKQSLHQMKPLKQGMLVLIDIYRFRHINDLFGFSFGDRLLQAMGKRLHNLSLEPQLVARMAGDEFLLYFDRILAVSELEWLQQYMQQGYRLDNTPINLKLQLGWLDLTLDSGSTSVILKRLDLARIKAKSSKTLMANYCQGEDLIQRREHTLLSHLPKALNNGQISLMYQPKINLHSQQYTQLEALIRWHHPEYGDVSPAEFIPLAEGAGIIDLVSSWVLDQVLQQQVNWHTAQIYVPVAINFSGYDVSNESLVDSVAEKLEHYHLGGDVLVIEITESALMNDFDAVIAGIDTLRASKVKLAIDDFGTGHSSLAYLKHLPVDEIKIDKVFLEGLLDDPHAIEIMQTSIRLATNLGYSVTVEGIEAKNIADVLASMGADMLQGDYFSVPLNAEQVTQLFTS